MKITNYVPENNWRDLQNKVSNFLNESGYSAETEKTIDTVRGTVEVDVFATSNSELVKQFICECKCWNTNVPQEKIHAFRTTVSDTGSMFGLFIVKKGFQTGAYEAAYRTNVLLKTWNEFIELIEKQWLIRNLIKIKQIASPLSVYLDPLDVPLNQLTELERNIYMDLIKRSLEQYTIVRTLEMSSIDKKTIEFDGNIFTAFDELFDYAKEFFIRMILEFEELFKRSQIEEYKFESSQHMMHPISYKDAINNINILLTELL